MHQPRVVGHGLFTGRQQIDDILQRSLSAQVSRPAALRNAGAGIGILAGSEYPDRVTDRVEPRSQLREIFERPALGRPVLGTGHHRDNRPNAIQAECCERACLVIRANAQGRLGQRSRQSLAGIETQRDEALDGLI